MSFFPPNVLLKIFAFLDIDDLVLGVRAVCRTWNYWTYDPSLWRSVDLSLRPWSTTTDVLTNVLEMSSDFIQVNGLIIYGRGDWKFCPAGPTKKVAPCSAGFKTIVPK